MRRTNKVGNQLFRKMVICILHITRAHSKAVAVKMVEEPDATAVDIRADYVAKHGAPSAAAPKIFFRYYFVNSTTGEKSGTMLAEVKWEAAAAAGGGD